MKKRHNTLMLYIIALFITLVALIPFNSLANNDTLLDTNNQEANQSEPIKYSQTEQNAINQKSQSNAPQKKQSKEITFNSIYDETSRSDGEVATFIERKGGDIIGLLQRGAKYFAIISFILCGGLMLFGSFGNSKLVSTGLLGICITLAVYATILHAPELMDKFVMWTRT